MNLQQFIKEALIEIIAGVAEAREAATETDASIGSDHIYGRTDLAMVLTDEHGRTVTMVEFDIALAQNESEDARVGIGVFLGSFGIGTQTASHGNSSTLSRIKFSIPVVFPGMKQVRQTLPSAGLNSVRTKF